MKKIILTLAALLPILMMAQPGMPNNPTPIDGGLGILLAAGAAYGIKKYRDTRKEE